MFDNDDAARHALRTLTSEPAPPVATSLDQVLRRGKRRVFMQRAGSVAGVVAVVAAIGVAAVLLQPGDQGSGVRVGTSNSATAPATNGSMPGWSPVVMPSYIDPTNETCTYNETPLPPKDDVPFLSVDVVKQSLTQAVQQSLGLVPTATSQHWTGATSRFLVVEVPMGDGNGQVQLQAGRFGGTPVQAADADRGAYGDCEAPLRRVLADGTVLQLYPVNKRHAFAPMRSLRVYQPSGRLYIITSAGYGDADMRPNQGSTSKSIVSGRGRLPTTEEQFAVLAERFVAGLG